MATIAMIYKNLIILLQLKRVYDMFVIYGCSHGLGGSTRVCTILRLPRVRDAQVCRAVRSASARVAQSGDPDVFSQIPVLRARSTAANEGGYEIPCTAEIPCGRRRARIEPRSDGGCVEPVSHQ